MFESNTTKVQLTLFGAPDVRRDGVSVDAFMTQQRAVALVAYLAAAGPDASAFHRRDRLVGLFWAEHAQEQARRNLRKLLQSIRDHLGDETLETRGDEEVRLSASHVSSDVAEFEDAVKHGLLARADELYRDELLASFQLTGAPCPDFDQWASMRRLHFAERAAEAAWKLATRLEGERSLTDAARWARRAAKLAQYDERRFRRAIELLVRVGDTLSVFHLYGQMERRLADLGARPSPETRKLIEDIRRM